MKSFKNSSVIFLLVAAIWGISRVVSGPATEAEVPTEQVDSTGVDTTLTVTDSTVSTADSIR